MIIVTSGQRRTIVVSGLCFVILAIAFGARTTGIHIDESSYLMLALNAPDGDSGSTGKPFLFYGFNYLFIHSLGFAFGPLRPISLHLFFIALFAVSLGWAVTPVARIQSRSGWWARVAILLTSPLVLVNATSLMMESAALPLLTVTLGCILRSGRPGPDNPGHGDGAPRTLLTVASALATAVKSTTIPALVLLAFAFRGRLRSRTHLIPIGIAAGLALNQAGLWVIGGQRHFVYGGPGELLSKAVLLDRALTRAWPYGTTWLFLAGISMAIAAALLPAQVLKNRECLILMLGSLAGVVLFQLVSVFPFARYCYPVMWAALLGVFLIIELEASRVGHLPGRLAVDSGRSALHAFDRSLQAVAPVRHRGIG